MWAHSYFQAVAFGAASLHGAGGEDLLLLCSEQLDPSHMHAMV